jgi:hypothetical protein
LLAKLEQRTEDIHKLPDGRSEFGYVVIGAPYQFQNFFLATVKCFSTIPIDFKAGLSNALRSIDIIESTTTNFDRYPGNVYVETNSKAEMYELAAVGETVLGSNKMAVTHARIAVGYDPSPLNKEVLVNALINSAIPLYSRNDFTGSLKFDTEAINLYESNGNFNSDYHLTEKGTIISLYERAFMSLQNTGQTNNLLSYSNKLFQIVPNIFQPPSK